MPVLNARRRLWLVLWLMLLSLCARAQQPLFNVFTPDLPVYPQYFSVVQGADQLLYIGYGGGVLRFDGARWIDIPVSTDGAVRALIRDRNDRIWVGGTNCFGYLKRQSDGTERFVEVSGGFAEQINNDLYADVWRIMEREDGIYIGSLRYLFVVDHDGRPLRVWHHSGRFGAMAEIDGSLWLQWRGQGLKRLVGDEFQMVPGGEQFASTLIYNLLALPDGRALLHTQSPRITVWEDGEFHDRSQLMADPQVEHLGNAEILDANSAAFSGDDGILRFVDFDRQQTRSVTVSRSYISEVRKGADGALLVISDEGVARLTWPPRMELYDERSGLRGGVNNLKLLDDKLLALGASSVFSTQLQQSELLLPLGTHPWTQGEAWDLIDFDGELLLADSLSLWRIAGDGSGVQQVAADDLYPRVLLRDAERRDRLWVGTEEGISLLLRDDSNWRLLGSAGHAALRTSSLAHRGPDSVWVGTYGSGLKVARWRAGHEPSLELLPVEVASGLPETDSAMVSQLAAGLWVSTDQGLFLEQDGQFQRDDLNGLDVLRPQDELVELRDGVDNELWAFSYRALYHRRADGWRVLGLTDLGRGAFTSFIVLPNGDALVGGASTLLRIDRHFGSSEKLPVVPVLTGISIEARGADSTSRRLSLDRPVGMRADSGSLDIQFALPDLSLSTAPQFQVRLEGLDEGWGPWSDRASVSYSALSPGSYRLLLRARSADGAVTEAPPLSIEVNPRWYQRTDLRLLAVLVGLLLAALLLQRSQRRRLQRLYQRNRELDALVHARTEALEEANVKLRSQAERDGLTGVGNRRYFDNRLELACNGARVSGQPLALLMIDVDNFKQYNDAHGHQAGDDALRMLAQQLTAAVRETTAVARYGGEEFALIAEHCSPEAAARLAHRLVEEIAGGDSPLTISVGVANFEAARDGSPSALTERADSALYEAKRQGRNRAVIA